MLAARQTPAKRRFAGAERLLAAAAARLGSTWTPVAGSSFLGGLSTIDCIDVYLEVGAKRTFAGSLEWPGWTRGGKDEEQALQALFDYAPRYAKVAKKLGFDAPKNVKELKVKERVKGSANTDFGSLGDAPTYDDEPVDENEHQRLQKILQACWAALDKAERAARGKELKKGPRGGGRELDNIVQHVLDAEGGYLYRLAWKRPKEAERDTKLSRKLMLEALTASVRGEVPAEGPRGGKRWAARYFVRREAWHVLDHAWEIEDRVT
jgi:hypothetical protein